MNSWIWQHTRTDHKDSVHPREILFSVLPPQKDDKERGPITFGSRSIELTRKLYFHQMLYKMLGISLKKLCINVCRHGSVSQQIWEMATLKLKIHIAALN